jgi:hypothetical protein
LSESSVDWKVETIDGRSRLVLTASIDLGGGDAVAGRRLAYHLIGRSVRGTAVEVSPPLEAPPKDPARPGRPPTKVKSLEILVLARLKTGPVNCAQMVRWAGQQGYGKGTLFRVLRENGIHAEGARGERVYRLAGLKERGDSPDSSVHEAN